MRINIPSFRLPEQVLDEEIGYIVDMGVDVRYNSPVDSLKALLDAQRVRRRVRRQRRARRARSSRFPAATTPTRSSSASSGSSRFTSATSSRSASACSSSASATPRWTAAARSKRLGATDVKVIARKTRKYFKASPWELEDAEEEGVEIIENLQPVRFIIENGVLTGMEFDKFRSRRDGRQAASRKSIGREILPCDTVVLAIGQDNAFPWIERDIGLEFDKWDMPVVDKTTFMSTRPGVFFGGDAAFGPANIIWAVEHGHQAAISIHNYCQGHAGHRAPAAGHDAQPAPRWACTSGPTATTTTRRQRQKMKHVDLPARFASMTTEVEQGFTAEQTAGRGRALPELRRADALHRLALHRVRRLHRHLPGRLPDDHAQRRRAGPAHAADAAPAENLDQPLFVSGPLKQTGRVMVKDENVCLHCGLCAERCPTYAWDMRKFVLEWPLAKSSALTPAAV